jgi:MraZ protein
VRVWPRRAGKHTTVRDKTMLLGTVKDVMVTAEGLVLPPHLHEGLEQGFVMTRGIDSCIAVFAPEAWDAVVQRIEGGSSLLSGAARLFHRHFYGGAALGALEPDGLMRIPQDLRSYASLDDQAVLVGVGSRLEIWNPERWSHEEFRMYERSFLSSAELGQAGV